MYRSRTDRLNQFRAEGYSAFRRRTGCRIPCSRHVYRVQEDFRMHNKEFVQERRTVISLQFFKAQEITQVTLEQLLLQANLPYQWRMLLLYHKKLSKDY